MKLALPALLAGLLVLSCNLANTDEEEENVKPVTPAIEYKETNYFFHDNSLFTEGLLMHNGQLLESTGNTKRSFIGISDLRSGKFIKKTALTDSTLFGEGIVVFNNKIYQLTYTSRIGFIYDVNTFKRTGQFTYNNKEGWGFTTDGTNLIMSDGTDTLTYLDPNELKPVKKLLITENGSKRDSLNELEYIKGYIYANVWLTHHIVKIDPVSGKVLGKLDLSPLAMKATLVNRNCSEMNGIAYDSTNDCIYVTGKQWPHIYQLKLKQE